MIHELADTPLEPPFRGLEHALIDEYLATHGHTLHSLDSLTPQARERLLANASVYASARLSEVDARSHYIHDLHGRPDR